MALLRKLKGLWLILRPTKRVIVLTTLVDNLIISLRMIGKLLLELPELDQV